MSWKKHFRLPPASQIPMPQGEGGGNASAKYSSYLPEVYAGAPNRIQRYYQYDEMDRDSDINAALDTIADFCTQSEEQNDHPLLVNYLDEANETEVKLIKQMLTKWIKINDFKSRLWYIFRNTIKNGDAVFLRDPETMEWLWVDHYNVLMVKVKENAGNVPSEYAVRGLEYSKQNKFATKPYDPTSFSNGYGQQQALSRPAMPNVQSAFSSAINGSMGGTDPRVQKNAQPQAQTVHVVDAAKVIHLSLSVGMDINWPFGQSVLEAIFKTYKQKELLEDSLIIYRVQRAPERRIFYIDTGTMPQPRAKAHIQAIKNEIHQRRIPNRTGGGTSILDAAYNPLCLDMATRVPLLDGRTLTIRELAEEHRAGRENWVYSCDPVTGEIVPGNITWAGETRRTARVIRLHLDNGETITCTPDHKVPVLGKGFVEAQHLTAKDSLVAFARRGSSDVFDHARQGWRAASRVVADFFHSRGKHQEYTFLAENLGAPKTIVHHKDFDPSNNDPRNLAFMNEADHAAFMAFKGKSVPTERTEELSAPVTRLVLIEDAGAMDVGTITIDGAERWHSHHTFAVEAGIFVKNSILEDYFFAQGSDGRGSKVETLPGGDNLGETGDLDYFTNKLARGLRIPPTYLSFNDQTTFNDGKIGQALIQEFRFNKYCMRLQSLLAPVFDREFKRFLKENGISIDNDMFELKFHPPQNFAKYRQIELDLQQTQVYSQVAQNTKLSERFKLKRFLNLTEEEVLENERLWAEENPGKIKRKTGTSPAENPDDTGLSAIGLRGGETDDFGGDDMAEPEAPADDGPDLDLSAPTPPDK